MTTPPTTPSPSPSPSPSPFPEPTSPLSPIAPFPPSPPRSQTRPREVYGFVAYAGTLLLFILYLLWALLPDRWLEALGVVWYPNREWAVLLPAYSVVLVLLTYFTYFALALSATPAFTDLSCITDTQAHILAFEGDRNPLLEFAKPDSIPHEYDIPLGTVNRVLYGRRRRKREDRSDGD